MPRITKLILLLFGFTIFTIFMFSCRRNIETVSEFPIESKTDKFFKLRSALTPQLKQIYDRLKSYNNQVLFVNKLHDNIGYPVWDKIQFGSFRNTKNINSKIAADSAEQLTIIPLSLDFEYLSGVIIVKDIDSETPIMYDISNEDVKRMVFHSDEDSARLGLIGLNMLIYTDAKTFNAEEFIVPHKMFGSSVFNDIVNDYYKVIAVKIIDSSAGSRISFPERDCYLVQDWNNCTCTGIDHYNGDNTQCKDWTTGCPDCSNIQCDIIWQEFNPGTGGWPGLSGSGGASGGASGGSIPDVDPSGNPSCGGSFYRVKGCGGTQGLGSAINSFNNRIINQLNHQCLKDVFNTVKSLENPNNFAAIIIKFGGETTGWDWLIREGPTVDHTANAETATMNGGGMTTINYDNVKNSTNLAIARTMIHEAFHAYLRVYYANDPVNFNKDFPDMYREYQKNRNVDWNATHHAYMEKALVSSIARALKEFAIKSNITIPPNSDYIFSDLAWAGLDYNNNPLLTSSDITRIHNRILAEQTGTTQGSEQPLGTKTCN